MKTVNNGVYRTKGHAWWDDEEGMFSTIRFFVNPVRFGYFRKVMEERGLLSQAGLRVLDVGCGGGFLSEDFARLGCRVTGLDPAPESVDAARSHAAKEGLAIDYVVGVGEALPFPGESFDVVVCCDVLEHVENVERVAAEIGRVLKPGGLFFFDTINRTFASWLFMIKVMQEWRATAFADADAHVWRKFLRPGEVEDVFARNEVLFKGFRGILPRANPVSTVLSFRDRARGKISFRELGRRLDFGESGSLRASYMGWGVKQPVYPPTA
jgi:2-polyprenyl-6-hydroxyphenyl methylase/3-demethylubiquinone-9 3-methyltransferase